MLLNGIIIYDTIILSIYFVVNRNARRLIAEVVVFVYNKRRDAEFGSQGQKNFEIKADKKAMLTRIAERGLIMKKFLSEFKEFAMQGDVLQLAVGVILGTAINAVAKSLASDIFMPIIGLFVGKINISSLSVNIPSYDGVLKIPYGGFLQTLLDFIVTAFCVFLMIKFVKKLSKISLNKINIIEKITDGKISINANGKGDETTEENAAADEEKALNDTLAAEGVSSTDLLLIEIRDLLKEQKKERSSDADNGLDN